MSEQPFSISIVGLLGDDCDQVIEQANLTDVIRCDTLQEFVSSGPAQMADIVIMSAEIGAEGRAAVATLRQHDRQANRYTAVLQCIPAAQISELPTLLLPGVDDYLLCPLEAAALRTRLDLAARLVRVESELMSARDGLRHRDHSLHDPLTGLGNWRYLVDHLEPMLTETRSRGGMTYCALLSIDDFGGLCESFDEFVRNEVLIDITDRLRKALRPTDIVARTAEDEFAVALRYSDSDHTRPWIFERVLRAIAYPPCSTSGGDSVEVTVSIGVCSNDGRDPTTPYKMLTAAAENVRTAQSEGGNALII